jgi:hypothetical protein
LFDLPAYQEVLFLYQMARDLHEAENMGAAEVDVLLPIGGRSAPQPAAEGTIVLRPEFNDGEPLSLDLDLTPENADAVDTSRECRILQLLLDGLRLQVVDTGRSHQRSRVDQTGQFVASHEDLVQLRFRSDTREIRPVRQDCVKHFLRPAVAAQMLDCAHGMFFRIFLPVQIVQETRKAPNIFVLSESPGVRPNCGLNGVHVVSQADIVDPLLEQSDGFIAGMHGLFLDQQMLGWSVAGQPRVRLISGPDV